MSELSFKYDPNGKYVLVYLPLTSPTGNIRVRRRSSNKEYGYQVHKNGIKDEYCYVEWQIKYDTRNVDESETKLGFTRSINGEQKYTHSLSDIINFFYINKIVSWNDLIQIKEDLETTPPFDLITENEDLLNKQKRYIVEDQPIVDIGGFEVHQYVTAFPLYLVSLDQGIEAEIGMFEGGLATSVLLPHFYLCIPFTSLLNFDDLNGRGSYSNEDGVFEINSNNIGIFLDILRLHGLMSPKHKSDVIDIIDAILRN